jgi:hypothetical protein
MYELAWQDRGITVIAQRDAINDPAGQKSPCEQIEFRNRPRTAEILKTSASGNLSDRL